MQSIEAKEYQDERLAYFGLGENLEKEELSASQRADFGRDRPGEKVGLSDQKGFRPSLNSKTKTRNGNIGMTTRSRPGNVKNLTSNKLDHFKSNERPGSNNAYKNKSGLATSSAIGGLKGRARPKLKSLETAQHAKKVMRDLTKARALGPAGVAKVATKVAFELGKQVRILEDVPFYLAIIIAIFADLLSLIPLFGGLLSTLLCAIPIFVLHLFAGAFKNRAIFKLVFSGLCFLIDGLIPGLSFFIFYTIGAVAVYIITLIDRVVKEQ